jgi:competence protein ComEC
MQATQPAWALALTRFIRHRAVVTAAAFASAAIVILMAALVLSRPDGNLHLWLLDMGHSNAILVQTPRGAQILVDGGRFPSRLLTALGDRMPFTDREIEALFITHPDEFDTSALNAVLDRYDVNVVLTNGQPNLSESFTTLQGKLATHEVMTVSAGYTLDTDDGTHIEILHPQQQPQLSDSMNDYALVLNLTYGDASFLLTSDLSREGQAALLEAEKWPLTTVFQLPQHGAARSLDDTFLAAAQPQLVILQADRANRNGDPDADTLALLGTTPIFRTDSGGTIHLWTDGRDLWVEQ